MLSHAVQSKAVDPRRLRHFVAVAEMLNFRKAAERLHMAQPALSVSIQKLESELGVRLFDRTSAGVALTVSGVAALAEARKVLFHNEQFVHAVTSVTQGTGGQLRVGFVGSTTFGLLQRLIPRFRAIYPGVELILLEATSIAIVQQIEGGTLDIGLLRTPLLQRTRARLVPLEQDHFVAALPRGNPLAQHHELMLSELANEPFVMYSPSFAVGLYSAVMLACQASGFVPRVTQEATQIQTILAMVESGLGLALVPSVMQRLVSDRLVFCRLKDLPDAAAIGIAVAYSPNTDSAAAQRFRALAVDEMSSRTRSATPPA